jgi:hypothetical protein
MDILDPHLLETSSAGLDKPHPVGQFRVGQPTSVTIIEGGEHAGEKQPAVLALVNIMFITAYSKGAADNGLWNR